MALKLDGDLVLAGAGNMGGALLAGWLERGLDPGRILVQDPAPPPRIAELLREARGPRGSTSCPRSARPPAVLLMAVKPQIMEEVFPPLAKLVGPDTVVLSVAAGRTIRSFERHLPSRTAVVRSIPNTPAAVGRGITVATANAHVSAAQKATCPGAAVGRGRDGMGGRRGADRSRHGRVGIGAGLCLLPDRVSGARPA